MGYSFVGYQSETDNSSVFYEECMYAYQSVFRKCFGREITEFEGVVTQEKITEFKMGLERFKADKENNRDGEQFVGYISNITYDKLCSRLSELLKLMENQEVCYLSIG